MPGTFNPGYFSTQNEKVPVVHGCLFFYRGLRPGLILQIRLITVYQLHRGRDLYKTFEGPLEQIK